MWETWSEEETHFLSVCVVSVTRVLGTSQATSTTDWKKTGFCVNLTHMEQWTCVGSLKEMNSVSCDCEQTVHHRCLKIHKTRTSSARCAPYHRFNLALIESWFHLSTSQIIQLLVEQNHVDIDQGKLEMGVGREWTKRNKSRHSSL